MKLAEALILRADCQKRIEQLKQRLVRIARVQEGDRPAEDPQVLLDEIERATSELMGLIQRINRTNSSVELEAGQTVSDALALRDIQQLRHGVYRDLAKAAAVTQDRLTRSEVRFQSTVSIPEITQRADSLAKEHRELDARIQALNWRVDLLE